jgi:3-dehydroquinate dehydratase / shikimate dehydrogenase
LSRQDAEAGSFDAVIHATTVGMFPHGDGCFFERRIPADLVFDMVYNPLETALLRRAREEGKTIITGLEMFIEQAVQQFEIWTGDAAPRPAMEKPPWRRSAPDYCSGSRRVTRAATSTGLNGFTM